MLKNKLIMIVFSLSLILAGCGSADNHKVSQSSGGTATGNKSTTSTNTNVNTDHSSGTLAGGSSNKTETSKSPSSVHIPASPQENTSSNVTIPNMSKVTAVRLADFKTGWIGGNGWIAKTTSEGGSWSIVYQGSGTVRQLFALNQKDVWATLNEGDSVSILLQSIDGGGHWVKVGLTPNNAFLHFTSFHTALSGNYLSEDGGKTWNSLPIPNGIVGDAYFHDKQNGWVITQGNNVFYIKRTVDGGNSWKTVMTKRLFSPLNGAIIRSAGTNDAWIELIGDSGMSQTSYSVFHTVNGGQSWSTVIANSTAGGGPAPGFTQDYNGGPINKGTKPGPLYVVNSQTAFMGESCPACDQQNSIGWTKDGGKTWINSNVTLAGEGDAFLAVSDSNHGWWITTENEKQSVMYTTTDGGYHWKKVHIFH